MRTSSESYEQNEGENVVHQILTNNLMLKSRTTTNGYQIIIDSGAASTVARLHWFTIYYQEMLKPLEPALQ